MRRPVRAVRASCARPHPAGAWRSLAKTIRAENCRLTLNSIFDNFENFGLLKFQILITSCVNPSLPTNNLLKSVDRTTSSPQTVSKEEFINYFKVLKFIKKFKLLWSIVIETLKASKNLIQCSKCFALNENFICRSSSNKINWTHLFVN